MAWIIIIIVIIILFAFLGKKTTPKTTPVKPREDRQYKTPSPQPVIRSEASIKPRQITRPSYPARWSIPAKEVRQNLKQVLVEDYDDADNLIKRKLTKEEIIELVGHWRDMINYSKGHFKDAFTAGSWFKYLQYVAVEDSRCCDGCKRLNGKVIRLDDPRAKEFFPPLHIGCRCTMIILSEHVLQRDGLTVNWPDVNLPDVYTVSLL